MLNYFRDNIKHDSQEQVVSRRHIRAYHL